MFSGAQTIVIFGDSFSVSEQSGGKTWVNHLEANVTIHNFSVASATVEDDLDDQLSRYFALPGKPWKSSPKSISYILFLGINDCGRTEECLLDEIVEKIKEAADRLYTDAGARCFVFVDVPPIDRSPQAALQRSESTKARVQTWNQELRNQVLQFVEDTPTAKVSFFSIHGALSGIFDDPEEYDFTEDDTKVERGEVWADDLHLTSRVHRLLVAEQMKVGAYTELLSSSS